MNQGVFALSSRGIGSPLPLLGLPGRSVSVCGWPGTHPEALDWRARVLANNGSVSAATLDAISEFCYGIDQFNIRNRFYRFNPFAGGELAAALVPLYTGPVFNGAVYGSAVDINTGFSSADYSETGLSGGFKPAVPAGKWLDTGLAHSALPAEVQIAMHLAGWHNGYNAVADPYIVGMQNATVDRFVLQYQYRATGTWQNNTRLGKLTQAFGSVGLGGVAQPPSHLLATRTGPTRIAMFTNGVMDSENATSTTGIAATAYNFYVFAMNNAGAIYQASGAPLGLFNYSIGAGLTQTESVAYYTVLRTLMLALGRTA